ARFRSLPPRPRSLLRGQHAGQLLRLLPGDDCRGAHPPARRIARIAQSSGRRRRGVLRGAGALLFARLSAQRRGGARRIHVVQPPSDSAGALLTWWIFPTFAQMYWLRLSFSAEYLFTRTEVVLSGRVASWQTLAAWIAAHPWQAMFGIGYKTLPYSNFLGSQVVADNMYLSLLVETGVAGLAALVWLNVAILRAA